MTFYQQYITATYQRLQPREQMLLRYFALFMLAVGLFSLCWQPSSHRLALAKQYATKQQALFHWISQHSNDGCLQNTSQTNSAGLLLEPITDLATEHNIDIKRFQPKDQNALQVYLDGANFKTLMAWLITLKQQQYASIEHISLSKGEQAGQVNAVILFVQPVQQHCNN